MTRYLISQVKQFWPRHYYIRLKLLFTVINSLIVGNRLKRPKKQFFFKHHQNQNIHSCPSVWKEASSSSYYRMYHVDLLVRSMSTTKGAKTILCILHQLYNRSGHRRPLTIHFSLSSIIYHINEINSRIGKIFPPLSVYPSRNLQLHVSQTWRQ